MITNSTATDRNVVGNAAPVVDSATNRIWLPFNRNNVETWISYSDDAGSSWAAPLLQPQLQRDDWKWVGVGPPAGVQLSSGRLLVPGYHSTFWPAPDSSSLGSGLTKGHVILSDDGGVTWRVGADDFGYRNISSSKGNTSSRGLFINECQAAELPNGRVVVNSRTFNDKRAVSFSDDGGDSFPDPPVWAEGLAETYQGCEGSTVSLSNGSLAYSGVQSTPPLRLYRQDLALFLSEDGGLSWSRTESIWPGSSAYSALVATADGGLAVLFERSDCSGYGPPPGCPLVFLPEHISFQVLV